MPLFYHFNYDLKIVSVYVFCSETVEKQPNYTAKNNVYFYRT